MKQKLIDFSTKIYALFNKIVKNKKSLVVLHIILVVAILAAFIFVKVEPAVDQTVAIVPTQAVDEITPTPVPVRNTPLVVGYNAFSQKFSPFFAVSGYDVDAEGLTQVSLLTTDRTGGIVYSAIQGETIPYNGVNYFYNGIADIKVHYDEASDITAYTMKIRDDIKFSDGHIMDADDIIFSYYVLCDPAYNGSSPLYTYNILGLTNYRRNNSLAENLTVSQEELTAALEKPDEEVTAFISGFVSDLLASELDLMKTMYGNPAYALYTEKHPVAKDLFAFFYNMDEAYDSYRVPDEAQVLADITAQYGADWKELGVNYNGSENYFATDLKTGIGDILLKKKLAASEGTEVPNIEGIKKLSQTEVEIRVKGFEAPAVYSICGIEVAPMHYYGKESLYAYEKNMFGFPRGDLSGIESRNTRPLGAGPYKYIKYESGTIYYEANKNYYKGAPKTKYLQLKETDDAERIAGVGNGNIDLANLSGSVERFQELKTYNSNGAITGDVISTSSVDNLGYGYIGINASTVNVAGIPDSDASKALRNGFSVMYAVYREASIDSYYGDAGSIINYPVSNTSWAAPQKTDAGYEVAYSSDAEGKPIFTADMRDADKYEAALESAISFFKAAGYTYDEAAGKFTKAPEGASLEYEVIIAANGTGDHPSYNILTHTRDALEVIGITLNINDPVDSAVMFDSIEANTHQMWVAAWIATVDPDMYQVYHSSNAIKLDKTKSNYYNITDSDLDKLILFARQSTDQSFRKTAYKNALDIILDWGVEVPVYQRQNMVLFSTERINMDTVSPAITTYWGWMRDIEKLEMK